VHVVSFEPKACDLLVPEPDILKVAAHAYKKRASKNICGLKAGMQLDHLLC
jgi:hypothetical protein